MVYDNIKSKIAEELKKRLGIVPTQSMIDIGYEILISKGGDRDSGNNKKVR